MPPEHVAGQLVPPLQSVVSVPVVQYVGSSQMPSLAYVHESPLLPPVLLHEHPEQSQPYELSSSLHEYPWAVQSSHVPPAHVAGHDDVV